MDSGTVAHIAFLSAVSDGSEHIYASYQERVVMGLPEKHYLDQEVYVNIFVDSGDGNYDYVCNHVFPAYLSDPEEEIRDEEPCMAGIDPGIFKGTASESTADR